MNTIGNLEVIENFTFIVPPKESIWVSFSAKGWPVKLNIIFDPFAQEQSVKVEPKKDHACITFSKWDNTLGSATRSPVELGSHVNGEKLYFMATHYLIGADINLATTKFDIQFLMGTLA